MVGIVYNIVVYQFLKILTFKLKLSHVTIFFPFYFFNLPGLLDLLYQIT